VQQLGGRPAAQLAPASAGLPALISGLLQACALSSQPDKLPQVLGRACSYLPVHVGFCCLEVLLPQRQSSGSCAFEVAAWLSSRQARSALELLLQFARHKGCGDQWGQILADRIGCGGLHPIGGVWVAVLALMSSSCQQNAGCSMAVAAALQWLQQVCGKSSSSRSSGGGQAAAKGRKGAAAAAAEAESSTPNQELWLVEVAAAGLDQLQQAAAAAVANGTYGCSVAPQQLAEALLLSPQLPRSQSADSEAAAAAAIAALATAAEVLASAVLARTLVPIDAWEQLAASASKLQHIDASAAADPQLQNLAISLHNAASAVGGAGSINDDGGAAGAAARARCASQLLAAAFQCSVLRWTAALAAGGGAEGAPVVEAAAKDLGRRAKACLTGLVRSAAGVGGDEAATLNATAGRTLRQLLALLGPRQALRQQPLLQGLLKLFVKLAAATHRQPSDLRSKAGSKSKAASSSSSDDQAVSFCTQHIINHVEHQPSAAATASQVADVIAYSEARCLLQLQARSASASESQQLQEHLHQSLAAAASAAPCGWSDAEWGAQLQLLAVLCGTADAAGSEGALADAAETLGSAAQQPAGGATKALRGSKSCKAAGSSKRQQQQLEQSDTGGDAAGWVAASKLEAAALCRCMAALQGAYSAAEAAATAAAAEAAAAASKGGEAGEAAAWEETEQQQQQQQQPASSSSTATTTTSKKGAAGKRGGKARGASGSSADDLSGVWTAAAATRWADVHSGLEHAAELWSSAAEAATTSGSSDDGSCVSRLPAASVQALLQAWHVAALQGWVELQQRLADVARLLLPCLAASDVQQLVPVLASMPQASWLAYLLAPAAIEQSVADALSLGAESSSADAAVGISRSLTAEQLQAAAEDLESATDSSSPWAQLNAARLHLAAAQAAAACGELPITVCCGERALVLSSHIYLACVSRDVSSSSSSGSSGAAAQPAATAAATPHPKPSSSPAGPSEPLLHWQSLGLYLSSLLLLANAHETAGCADEALRMLREAAALAGAARCSAIAAAAHGAAARVWCKRGDSKRAEVQLRSAQACWGAIEGGCDDDDAPVSPNVVLGALVACAAGDVALSAGDAAAARDSYSDAAAQLKAAVAASGGDPLCCWAASLWADAHIGLVASESQPSAAGAAAAALCDALAALSDAPHHPVAAAALEFELLQLRAAAVFEASGPAAGQDAPQGLRLVGYGGTSAHSNLMEEFACALEGNQGTDTAKASSSSSRPAGATAKARGGRKPAARGKTGTAAAAARGSSSTAAAAAGEPEAACSPAALLRPLLQLLWPSRHAPLLFKRVCGVLTHVCELQGAVHACALFLQLSIGVSASEQQLLAVSAKCQQQRRRSARAAAKGGASKAPSERTGDDDEGAPDWHALLEVLDKDQLLQRLSEACRGSSDPGGLLAAVDAVGRSWWAATLGRLPRGTALVSLSEAARGAGSSPALMVCRLEGGGAPPLLAVLPGPERGMAATPAALAAELTSILQDSAASMSGSAAFTTEGEKAAWWRTRIRLDERLAALLRHAGRDWLGPWRCLLGQPAGSGERVGELRAAAAGFVAEQFEFVFGELCEGQGWVGEGQV